jgi:predicted ATPase
MQLHGKLLERKKTIASDLSFFERQQKHAGQIIREAHAADLRQLFHQEEEIDIKSIVQDFRRTEIQTIPKRYTSEGKEPEMELT